MKKRSYLLLILFVCSVSLLHAEIITGECGENGDNVTYTWDTETGVLEISGIGNMKDWGFYAPSFFDRGIKTLRINDGVTSVGAYAFTDCTSLTNIIFPGSVTNIGERAFFGCNLLNVVKLPQNLIRIGSCAFGACYDIVPIFPESLTEIENGAFCDCRGLKSVNLPKGLKKIGADAFSECRDLASIVIPDAVEFIGQ